VDSFFLCVIYLPIPCLGRSDKPTCGIYSWKKMSARSPKVVIPKAAMKRINLEN